jgi:hypothetical protein
MEWLGRVLWPEQNELERWEKTVEVSWESLLDSESETETPPIDASLPVPGKEIFLLNNFLSKQECLRIIDAANSSGFGKTNYPKYYRGNLRLIAMDSQLAQRLYLRLLNFVPQTVEENDSTWVVHGLNECWRMAKYYPGDRFGAHVDAYFQKSETEKSMFTVNIYLNGDGDFVGGTTRFYESRKGSAEETRVVPSPGLCLMFRQPYSARYLHDGEEVSDGVKYLMRSDVVYLRQDRPCENSQKGISDGEGS